MITPCDSVFRNIINIFSIKISALLSHRDKHFKKNINRLFVRKGLEVYLFFATSFLLSIFLICNVCTSFIDVGDVRVITL